MGFYTAEKQKSYIVLLTPTVKYFLKSKNRLLLKSSVVVTVAFWKSVGKTGCVKLSIVCGRSKPPLPPSGKYVCPVIYAVLDLWANMPTKGTIY